MPGCELSVVVPVFNDQVNLDRMVAELQANNPDDSWEVLVVDDGSPQLLKFPPNTSDSWKMIRLEPHHGVARARNAGVKKARGKHIIFTSVFLRLPEDYISRMKTFIASHSFDFAQHLIEKAPGLEADYFQSFLANQSQRISTQRKQQPIKQSLFTAAVVEKEMFCKLKGFDDSMQHYGGHEMDLIYRMDKAGYTQRILIDNIPLQRLRLEDHTTIRERLQEYGKIGLPNLLKKHPELKKAILVKPLLWGFMSFMGLPKRLENTLKTKIEADSKLSTLSYRLYLHLLVRNAWTAR